MKKRILSLVLTLAMVLSMFAGLATTASAAQPMTLTFALNANPGGWPTANSTTTTNYTYTLDGVGYTFALKNVKSNAGYLMLTQPAAFGLPAISGYKLTKVVANNSSGCSTSVKVGVSSSDSSATYISGGDAQTWATKSSSYTYNLTGTADNTMYYLYATIKNAQIISLELTYEPVGDTSCEHANVTDVEAVAATCTEVGYTAGVFCTDCQTYISGHETIAALGHTWDEGVETLAATCTAAGEMTYTCTVCGATKTEATPLAAHNYVDNVCSVCGTVDPTSVDYTGLYYISVDNTYMTSTLTATSTKRYTAVDTGLAAGEPLPESITLTAADEKTFRIEKQEDGSYVIRAASVDGNNYLTYESNAGNIGAADAAIKVSIVEANGTFKISNDTVDSAATRYLAKNNTAANMYYGWYKSGQHDTLSLIPVTIDAEAHVHTYAWDGNVGVDGSHTLVCECSETTTEACADAEPVHTAGNCQNYGSTAYTCDVCGYTWTVADTELGDHNYLNGICTVCGAEEPAKATYALVTDLSQLSDGAVIVLGNAANSKANGAIGTKFFDAVDATFADGYVSGDDVVEITLNVVDDGWTLSVDGTAIKVNGADVALCGEGDAATVWAISVDAATGAATISVPGTDPLNRFLFNKNSPRFKTYTSDANASMILPEIYVKGGTIVVCEHENTEVRDDVAATCTTAGYTGDTYCLDCGKLLAEGEEIAALGHDMVWDGNVGEEGYHGVACSRCEATDLVECTMVNGTCSICGYTETVADPYLDESLTFLQAAMCIESYIGADFIVKNTTIANYTDAFVRLEYPSADGTVTEDLSLLVYSSKYKYVEHQVAAKEMSDVISATLYASKDGVQYHGPTLAWSVASGSRAGMDKATATAADKAFYVALLNYGAKAQVFFDYNQENLATDVLTAEEIATYLPAARVAVNAEATTSNGLSGVNFYRMAFSCGPVTVLNIIFKLGTGTAASDVECRIEYVDRTGAAKTEVIDEFTKSGSSYVALFDKLTAKQLSSSISITFYSKTTGQAISETKTYSEESYIYANPYTGTARGDMFTALIQYADAAAVKFG